MQGTRQSRLTRRGLLGVPLVVWIVIATAAVAFAVVGFVVTLGMSGSVTTPDGIDVEYYTGGDGLPVAGGWSAGTTPPYCDTVSLTATDFNVEAIGYPNSECAFWVYVVNNGPSDARLQRVVHGLQGSGQGMDVTTRGGVTQEDFCGTLIPADGTPTWVGFTMSFAEDLQPNISYTMGGEDGLKFVADGAYIDTECN